MKIEKIKASDAPAPPRKLSKVASEILAALEDLGKDEVLRLTPAEGKTVRGLKTSVGRIASNAKIKIESWNVDEDAVFVRKLEK